MKEADLNERVLLISKVSIALLEATSQLPHQAVRLQQDIEAALRLKSTIKPRASRFRK